MYISKDSVILNKSVESEKALLKSYKELKKQDRIANFY